MTITLQCNRYSTDVVGTQLLFVEYMRVLDNRTKIIIVTTIFVLSTLLTPSVVSVILTRLETIGVGLKFLMVRK